MTIIDPDRVPCRCGDGTCMACDDAGTVPRALEDAIACSEEKLAADAAERLSPTGGELYVALAELLTLHGTDKVLVALVSAAGAAEAADDDGRFLATRLVIAWRTVVNQLARCAHHAAVAEAMSRTEGNGLTLAMACEVLAEGWAPRPLGAKKKDRSRLDNRSNRS